jgi:SAM-dependent methyltransferase
MTALESSIAPQSADRHAGEIAERVRRFYETHPYPRPVEGLDDYRSAWEDEGRRRAMHHLVWPGVPFESPGRRVLVAGCGTAQGARYALRDPGHEVLGIDVSEASLEATRTLKERYGLDNLELARLPIEDAGELEREFDLVVCTGVLHHLPDPLRGLGALSRVLAPGGVLHLMVYAPYGRTGVYMMQRYGRLLGLGTSEAEIDDLAASLREIPPHHPLRFLFEKSPDFRSHAGLADALLNPQDRAYTVPELLELVESAGLRFGRWVRQASYQPYCGAPLLTPHRDRLAALDPEAQWAAMELFRGTMVRHSVLLRRYGDDLPTPEKSDWRAEAGDWRSWVPVRRADTVTVTEGIPETAAAVLINRSHDYTDLYLPVDHRQAAWLSSVNGQRPLGGIIGDGEVEAGMDFFRRLWWYDQVVFDTSRD